MTRWVFNIYWRKKEMACCVPPCMCIKSAASCRHVNIFLRKGNNSGNGCDFGGEEGHQIFMGGWSVHVCESVRQIYNILASLWAGSRSFIEVKKHVLVSDTRSHYNVKYVSKAAIWCECMCVRGTERDCVGVSLFSVIHIKFPLHFYRPPCSPTSLVRCAGSSLQPVMAPVR